MLAPGNYYFQVVKLNVNACFGLKLANPRAFYHKCHLPVYFPEFSKMEQGAREFDLETRSIRDRSCSRSIRHLLRLIVGSRLV